MIMNAPEVGFSGSSVPVSILRRGSNSLHTNSARAREIILLSDKLTAAEALAKGMVSRVVPDEELRTVTLKIAGRFANKAPWAARLVKQNLNAALTDELGTCLDLEAANMVAGHGEIGRALLAARSDGGRSPNT
jgi:enoyl-CoA hydratase/carnithine racemase